MRNISASEGNVSVHDIVRVRRVHDVNNDREISYLESFFHKEIHKILPFSEMSVDKFSTDYGIVSKVRLLGKNVRKGETEVFLNTTS